MKLGELFVDLGVNSGSAFSTLANFAFKFNNVADTASKMIKGLEHLGGVKPLADFSQGILDLSRRISISTDKIQGLRRASMLSGADFSSMASKLEEFEKHRAGFAKGDATLLKQYGIYGITDEDIRTKSSLDIIRKVVNKINEINEDRFRMGLSALEGYDVRELATWTDYFKNQDLYDNDKDNLTREQLEESEALNDSFRQLKTNVDDISKMIATQITPYMQKFVDTINEFVNSETVQNVINKGKGYVNKGKELWNKGLNLLDKYGIVDEFKEDLAYVGAGAKLALGLGLDENSRLGTTGNIIAADFLGATPLKWGQAANLGSDLLTSGALSVGNWIEESHKAHSNLSKEEEKRNKNFVYNFFRSKGLSDGATRALMGNIMGESAFNPYALGDNGEAFGLAQWRDSKYDKRRTKLENFATERGTKATDLLTQLEFMYDELRRFGFSKDRMNSMRPEELVKALVEKYEITGDFEGDTAKRIKHMNNLGSFYDVGGLEAGSNQSKTINVYNHKTQTYNVGTPEEVIKLSKMDMELDMKQFNLLSVM